MYAAQRGDDGIIQDLIAANADIHATANRQNALSFAIEKRHYRTARILSEAGVSHEFLTARQISAAGLGAAPAPSLRR